MPRHDTERKKEYQPLSLQSEALWALIAVIALTVGMEVWSTWVA